MNKRKFWVFLSFYLINLIVVGLVIGLWITNRTIEILLALYLLLLTGFFSYSTRKKR
ncbi:MAG: hypothetical protein PHP61_02345 [Candidatus Izemoplasmatales bacterium]|nr:hypothetical protein [Candidatus Izemoplasmatales bacterium]MDD4354723.1 hypothetical protein [Candidatus Izemoplasmatales bacterium]MDD4987326.1 hypothetical protein [Candidatus Izemoplasmatales bacterium]MDY0372888.1 hypothetical protein [Candidatus Izemoplasmatales bacterium]NLF48332.1 hypothetical protein [Acholeplasmataceae bacterium]